MKTTVQAYDEEAHQRITKLEATVLQLSKLVVELSTAVRQVMELQNDKINTI